MVGRADTGRLAIVRVKRGISPQHVNICSPRLINRSSNIFSRSRPVIWHAARISRSLAGRMSMLPRKLLISIVIEADSDYSVMASSRLLNRHDFAPYDRRLLEYIAVGRHGSMSYAAYAPAARLSLLGGFITHYMSHSSEL